MIQRRVCYTVIERVRQLASFVPRETQCRIALALPFLAMIAVTGLDFRVIGDEPAHLRIIERVARDWPRPDLSDYYSLSLPLPYVIWSAWGKIVGFDIWKLRLLAVLSTYLAANVLYGLCKRHTLPYPLLSTWIYVFHPYVFFHGFTVYTNSIAALFGILSLRFLLLEESRPGTWMAGCVWASLAALTRPSYLVLPAGILAYEVLRAEWGGGGSEIAVGGGRRSGCPR